MDKEVKSMLSATRTVADINLAHADPVRRTLVEVSGGERGERGGGGSGVRVGGKGECGAGSECYLHFQHPVRSGGELAVCE